MMLPFSIRMFMSLTQAPSTLRNVDVARLTPSLTASSKLFGLVALISVTRATLIEPSLSLTYSFLSETGIYPATRKLNARRRGRAPPVEGGSEFCHHHRFGGRLRGASLGLDGYCYGVGPFQRLLDDGGDRVPFGVEEAARLGLVALDDPDLVGPVLGRLGKVLGHQDPVVVLQHHHLRLGLLRGSGSLERDHPALLLRVL